MADRYFYELDDLMADVPGGKHCRLEGVLLTLDRWDATGMGELSVSLDNAVEAFVVPLGGTVRVVHADSTETEELTEGAVAILPDAGGGRFGLNIGGSAIVASMPAPSAATTTDSPARPEVFRFDDVLEDKYAGWRFYARDGQFLTVGCSYRTAPPPSRETPHTHSGEQFNVALEGLFEMTIGGVTDEIQRGWASHVPPETLHTGLHKRFPYFQLVFSTPPRGKEYDEFLASIYQAKIER